MSNICNNENTTENSDDNDDEYDYDQYTHKDLLGMKEEELRKNLCRYPEEPKDGLKNKHDKILLDIFGLLLGKANEFFSKDLRKSFEICSVLVNKRSLFYNNRDQDIQDTIDDVIDLLHRISTRIFNLTTGRF